MVAMHGPHIHIPSRSDTFYLHCLQSDWTSPGKTVKEIQMSTMLSLLRQCRLHWLGHKQWLTMNPKGHPIHRAIICQKANWPSSSLLSGCWQTGPQAFPNWSSHWRRCHSRPSSVAAGTSDWVVEIRDHLAHSGYILFGPQ